MVNDQGLDCSAAAFDLEAKPVYYAENSSNHVMILRIVRRQIEIV